jgi:hypothetical protein
VEESSGPRRAIRFLRTTPCATLLAVQLLGVLVYPSFDESSGQSDALGRTVLGLFGIAVLFLAVLAVRRTPALTWVAGLLGLPLIVLTVWDGLSPGSAAVTLASAALHAAFYFYTAYALVRYMFNDEHVTTDELFATGAAFTVLAWGFAYLYLGAQTVWPQSFTAHDNPDAPRTWFELLYLSFTTLTSTGLSDVTPVQPHARSFVMIEQVLGLMYVAFIVARLVGLQMHSLRRRA